jgi:hypothetical protein
VFTRYVFSIKITQNKAVGNTGFNYLIAFMKTIAFEAVLSLKKALQTHRVLAAHPLRAA